MKYKLFPIRYGPCPSFLSSHRVSGTKRCVIHPPRPSLRGYAVPIIPHRSCKIAQNIIRTRRTSRNCVQFSVSVAEYECRPYIMFTSSSLLRSGAFWSVHNDVNAICIYMYIRLTGLLRSQDHCFINFTKANDANCNLRRIRQCGVF